MKAKVRSREYLEKWFRDNGYKEIDCDWVKSDCEFCDTMFDFCNEDITIDKGSCKYYDYNGEGWGWLKEWLILDENEEYIKIIGDGTTLETKVIENGKKLTNVIGVKIVTDLDGTTVDITRRYRGNVQVELGVED